MLTRSREALVILQARTGSERLPNKVLALIDGLPIVAHCLRRLIAADVGPVVLATTWLLADDAVAEIGWSMGAGVVRGPVQDVLARYIHAAAGWTGKYVIRATADNPAVDPAGPARVLEHLAKGADYVVEAGLPVGAAVEGVTTAALRRAAEEAVSPYDREHVTPFVKRRTDLFRVLVPEAPPSLRRPELRLTVDTATDLAFVRTVLERTGAGRRIVPLDEIVAAADEVRAASEVA